jgi:hypothetical protein
MKTDANFGISNRKPAAQRWNHVYRCYKKRLTAEQGFAELCFFCSEWFTNKKEWTDHCQAHLDEPDMIPTQCNPFNYGGCLACPGLCSFCLRDPTLPATTRFHQFPDRGEWREHIHGHMGNLECYKVLICPHPRPQCDEAFESEQELKFHLQDVHCYELTKGFKRLNLEHEVDAEPHEGKKARDTDHHGPDMKFDAYCNQEFKFVDEGPKLCSLETLKSNTSINSKRSTPTPDLLTDGRESGISTPDLVTDGTESGISTPLSSLCNDILDNIDPLLLASAPAADAPIQAPVHDVIDVDNLLDIDEQQSHLAEITWSAKYNGATQSTC